MICYNQETLNLALKEEEKPISITDSANEILLNFAEELKIENSTLLEPLVSYYFTNSQNSFRFMFLCIDRYGKLTILIQSSSFKDMTSQNQFKQNFLI